MHIGMIDPSLFTLPYDQELADGLEQIGHDVTLFGRRLRRDDGIPGNVRLVEAFYRVSGSKPVSRLPQGPRLAIKGLEHVVSMAWLLRRLARMRPDIIHFQWLPLPLVDGRLLGAFRRIAPLVLTVHDTNPFNGDPSSRLQARGFLGCLSQFDSLIVHTEQGRSRLCAQGIPDARLNVVPHGTIGAAQPRAGDDPMDGILTFLLFGKIKPYKGADILIKAFAMLPERLRAQARVRIIGKPYMDLQPLHELVQSHGLAHQVSIEPHFVEDKELPTLFSWGSVAVFPYREIDASGVLAQALAYARPVVASRLGLFNEMLEDDVHGHLVPPEDVAALAAAMTHLIEDRAFAAACSRHAAMLSSQAPSWKAIARRSAAVYTAAMAAAAPVSAGRSRATEISISTRKITGGNC